MPPVKSFMLLAPAALAGVAAGGAACSLLGLATLTAPAWAAFAAAALIAMAVGAVMLWRTGSTPPLPVAEPAAEPEAAVAAGLEAHRRLRHDIRGALSPALLTADRLLTHADPAVQRAGDIVVRAVDRAVALLADVPAPDATPPGRP